MLPSFHQRPGRARRRRLRAAAGLLALGVCGGPLAAPRPALGQLVDRAAALGIADSARATSGAALVDFDGDGDLDLALAVLDGHNRLYRNDGAGPALADVALRLGLARGAARASAFTLWADYDSDGDPDLLVGNDGEPNQLFRQSLGGFTDLGAFLGLDDPGRARAGAWADVDADGDLDLFLANLESPQRLYRTDSPGAPLGEVAAAAGLAGLGPVEACAFADFDLDGDLDLALSGPAGNHRLLRNDGGRFFDLTLAAGWRRDGDGAGLAWADFDGDGDPDLAQALADAADRLYRNDGGAFSQVAGSLVLGGPLPARASAGVSWVDYDLDGLLDLYTGADGRPLLLRNTGGRFLESGACNGVTPHAAPGGAVWGDLDGDRDPDLIETSASSGLRLLENRAVPPGRHALAVRLEGVRSPSDGIGARVRAFADGGRLLTSAVADGGSGLRGQLHGPLLLGLGSRAVADSLVIDWPAGGRQLLTAVAADAELTVRESVVDAAGVTLLGSLPIDDFAPHVADLWGYADASGEYALVCKGNGLLVVDVTEPATPVVVAEVAATGFDLKDVKTYRTHAYAVQENGRLLVIDLAVPAAAALAGEIGEAVGYHNAFVDTTRGRLYLVGHRNDEALQIYDLRADPVDPPLLGTYGDYYSHDVQVRGDRALLFAIQAGGFYELVDVSDPAAVRRVARFTHPDVAAHSGWLTADGRFAFTCDEVVGGHLRVWELADPTAVHQVAEFEVDAAASIHNVHLEGDRAFIAYYDRGLRVLDVSQPAAPLEIAHWTTTDYFDGSCTYSVFRGVWGVYPHAPSGHIYWTDMCGGALYVGVLTVPPAPVGPGNGPPAPGGGAPAGAGLELELAGVQPVRAVGAQVVFRLPRAAPVRLRLFDVRGRLCRTLVDGRRPAGPHLLDWNGRDDRGRRLAAGVYFLRLAVPGAATSRRLVLLP